MRVCAYFVAPASLAAGASFFVELLLCVCLWLLECFVTGLEAPASLAAGAAASAAKTPAAKVMAKSAASNFFMSFLRTIESSSNKRRCMLRPTGPHPADAVPAFASTKGRFKQYGR